MAAYKEGKSIGVVLKNLVDQMNQLQIDTKIFVINDLGAPDEQLYEECKRNEAIPIDAPCNLGSQGALVFGLRTIKSKYDYVITMDSDGQDDVKKIKLLLESVKKNPESIAVAMRSGTRPEGRRFNIGYGLYKIIFRILTGITPDFGNYAAYSNEVAERIIKSPDFDMTYSMALPIIAPLVRIPITRLIRTEGESRVGWKGLFEHSLRSTLPHLRTISLRVFFFSCIVIFLATIIAGTSVFLKIFLPQHATPVWPTVVVMSSALLSVQLIGISMVLFLFAFVSRQISFMSKTLLDWRIEHALNEDNAFKRNKN
jgi:hypothetical protein